MTDHDTAFALPPMTHAAGGAPRRVGFEVEFRGLSARAAALALQAGLGGTVVEEDPQAFTVAGTPRLGDLAVELNDEKLVGKALEGISEPSNPNRSESIRGLGGSGNGGAPKL